MNRFMKALMMMIVLVVFSVNAFALTVANITTDETPFSATIMWDTDVNANGKVYYGTVTVNEFVQEHIDLRQEHVLYLIGLEEMTQYFFIVQSCNTQEGCVNSTITSFTTPDGTAPEFSSIEVRNIIDSSATIAFVSSESATAKLHYGVTQNSMTLLMEQTSFTQQFQFDLISLIPATTYYYQIELCDSSQNCVNSTRNEFETTGEDYIPPDLSIVHVPEYANTDRITINGTSEVDALINVFVNPTNPSQVGLIGANRQGYVNDDGTFVINNVPLDLTRPTNTVVIYARDSYGNENTRTFFVNIDVIPPTVVGGEIPDTSNDVAVQFTGTVDEDVRVVAQQIDTTEEFSLPAGPFDFSITLNEGDNSLLLRFIDIAGNEVVFSNDVYVDTIGPTFEELNLHDLDPTYIQEVTVSGKLSERGIVTVLVNGHSDSSGAVSTSLFDNLNRLFSSSNDHDDDYIVSTDENGYFSVDIYLSKDPTAAWQGNETPDGPEYAGYGSIGQSNDVENHVEVIAYDRAHNRVYDDAMIRFASCDESTVTDANGQTSIGGRYWNVQFGDVSPSVIQPAMLLEGAGQVAFSVELEWQGPSEKTLAAITSADFGPNMELSQEDRDSMQLDWLGSPRARFSNDNLYGYVIIPFRNLNNKTEIEELTTIRFPMMLTLDYEYTNEYGTKIQGVQKTCTIVDLGVDVEVAPDVIPGPLLDFSIGFIGNASKLIDHAIGPVKAARDITFVGSLITMANAWVKGVQEDFACLGFDTELEKKRSDFAKMYKAAFTDDTFNYYQTTVCEPYDETQDNKALTLGSSCSSCIDAVKNRIDAEKTVSWWADRIYCPKAPTFSTYVKDAEEGSYCEQVKESAGSIKQVFKDAGEIDSIKDGNDVYPVTFKGADSTLSGDSLKYACVNEYIYDWSSVGVTDLTGEFDEVAVSGCIEARYGSKDEVNNADVQKYCQQSGLASLSIQNYNVEGNANSICSPLNDRADVFVQRDDDKFILRYTGDKPGIYDASLVTQQDIVDKKTNQLSEDVLKRVGTNELLFESKDCSCREEETLCNEYTTGTKRIDLSIINQFCGPADKIVLDPTAGIVSSVNGVCLTGIAAYLEQWQQVMDATQLCFENVKAGEDLSSSVCKATLTQYACDLLYEGIGCFAERYGSAGTTADGDKGPGDMARLFGAISRGGDNAADQISDRYGATSMYKAMFADKQLVHSFCLYAFTGDWDLDLDALFNSGAGAIPIDTTAMLYPASMRFMSSDPLEQGNAIFNYHFGVAVFAGADVDVKLKLQCSTDYTCSESDGFEGGRCDCVGKEEPIVTDITGQLGTNRVARLDSLDTEIYVNLLKPIRYDTAILEWTYTDNEGKRVTKSVDQKINLVGGSPPIECNYDLDALRYHCDFFVDRNGLIHFTTEPKIVNAEGSKVFYMGETIELDYALEKISPKVDDQDRDSNLQIPKGVCYELYNHNNRLLKKECEEITDDGLFDDGDFTIPNKNGAWVLGREDFSGRSTSVGTNVNLINIEGTLVPLDTNYLQSQRADVSSGIFLMSYDVVGNYVLITPRTRNADGSYTDLTTLDPITPDNSNTARYTKQVQYRGMIIRFDPSASGSTLVEFTVQQGTSTSQDVCPQETVDFTLKVKAVDTKCKAASTCTDGYDSRNSEMDEGKIAQYDGKPQEKVIKFKTICQDTTQSAQVQANSLTGVTVTDSNGNQVQPNQLLVGTRYILELQTTATIPEVPNAQLGGMVLTYLGGRSFELTAQRNTITGRDLQISFGDTVFTGFNFVIHETQCGAQGGSCTVTCIDTNRIAQIGALSCTSDQYCCRT